MSTGIRLYKIKINLSLDKYCCLFLGVGDYFLLFFLGLPYFSCMAFLWS